MKKITTLALVAICSALDGFTATPTITGVVAQQRYPWNGKVDITYAVTGDIAAEAKQKAQITSLRVTATDKANNDTIYMAANLSGDKSLSEGTHTLVWDMDADGLSFKSSNVVFRVACEVTNAFYCVVDLSAGANAASYPVEYLTAPPNGGFNVDEYKTTKLVLRRIEPGSFLMCGQYNVTLTKPFFIGIFEVTLKQYELVVGRIPDIALRGDVRPVHFVSWNTFRGNVDDNSFVGRIQSRTGLDFDLPTEAQWEYACRAGTTSAYNNGGNAENDLKSLGRYYGNFGNRFDGAGGYEEHTTVGSYLPNAWGIYDMHGNVAEWCMDWYGNLQSGSIDPCGPLEGNYRVVRGGGWFYEAHECTSNARSAGRPTSPSNGENFIGFRISRTLTE